MILPDVLELEEEEDSELKKRKARASLQGDTDGQVTVTCRACVPLAGPEETRGPRGLSLHYCRS